VIESATIQSEIDGEAESTGMASLSDAQALATTLKSGPLPLSVAVVSES
jgi:preprotein translocase subunit SecD